MSIKDLGEIGLIDRIRKEIGSSDKLYIPIGDDSAAFELRPPFYTLLTTDSQVENVHFSYDNISPEDLGFKALSVNVSDIAAMAGIPKYAVIALGLRPEMEVDYVTQLYKGMKEAADKYNLALAGGDVTSSETFFINITVLGEVEPDILRRRGEASPGDIIYVTGRLGASAAGMQVLKNDLEVKSIDYLVSRHNRPAARTAEARLASENGARAMQDISDGLITELNHICRESGTGALIEAERIPIDKGVEEVAEALGITPLELALSGGEDYELVFTVTGGNASALEKVFDLEGLSLYKVGNIIEGDSVAVSGKDGEIIDIGKGWEHLTSK